MVFRPKSSPRPYNKIKLWLEGKLVVEVDSHRILGTLFDNKLSFEPHFQQVIAKGYGVLQDIKSFSTVNKIPSTKSLTCLYKTLVRSIVDFSEPAICNISRKSLNDVATLERSCLIYATKMRSRVSSDVLSVMTNVIPIDLHLKLRSAENLTRMLSKSSCIRNSYEKWKHTAAKENKLTTLTKMDLAFKQIMRISTKEIKVHTKQLYLQEIPPNLIREIIIKPLSSKTSQIEMVNDLLGRESYDFIICSDGSTIKEESRSCGKSGAAAVIFEKSLSAQPVGLKRELGTASNNYVAELVGINIGLHYLNSCQQSTVWVCTISRGLCTCNDF